MPEPRQSPISRRTVLAAGAVGASAVALTACSKASDSATSNNPVDTTPAGTSAAQSRAAASSSLPVTTAHTTRASSAAAASSTASAGPVLAKLSDIAVGSSISATTTSGDDILITRTGQNSVVAFSAICTHMGCTVAASFHCPCHGSVYNKDTGQPTAGPAPRALAPVNVAVAGGNVVEA